MKEKTLKAGAIILSAINKDSVALLYRSKLNDWSFPKGHVEVGENAHQAMIREIHEETGLDVDFVKNLPDLEYITSADEDVFMKMFLVSSLDDSKVKIEHENDKIEWVPFENVVGKLSYDNLKEYFGNVLPMIKEK